MRILTALLSLLLTVGGWFAVPASCTESGHDSSYISRIAKGRSSHVRARIGTARHNSQPSLAFLVFAGAPVHVLHISPGEFRAALSRPADGPPAYRFAQRPPPHNA